MKKIIFFVLLNLTSFIFADDFINKTLDNQDDLIKNIEIQVGKMNGIINLLKVDNINMNNKVSDLEKINQDMSVQLNNMYENNESLKLALNSNKEDTHEVIAIMGNMFEDIDKLNKQKSRTNKFVQIAIPSATIPLALTGLYLYTCTDYKELGKVCGICGATLFIGGELVWNCGKYIFKLW